MSKITVYGADWCGLTTRSLDFLRNAGVDFDYIDVDDDPKASEWVKNHNNGKEKKPTIDLNGEILTAPSNSTLKQALERKHLLKS